MTEERIRQLAHGIFGYRDGKEPTEEQIYFVSVATRALRTAVQEAYEHAACSMAKMDCAHGCQVGGEIADKIRALKTIR